MFGVKGPMHFYPSSVSALIIRFESVGACGGKNVNAEIHIYRLFGFLLD